MPSSQTPFTGSTPIGEVSFTNLIYTFDPDAPRKLVLAAHFDSLYFPNFPQNQVRYFAVPSSRHSADLSRTSLSVRRTRPRPVRRFSMSPSP